MIEKGIIVYFIFAVEPDYPEDEKSLEELEKKAKAWNHQQRQNSPKGSEKNSSSPQSSLYFFK